MRTGNHAARHPHHRRHSRLCGKCACNIGRAICMRKQSNVCARDFIFQLHIQACICTLHTLCYLDVYNCASIVGMACAIFTLRRLRRCDRNKFCTGFFLHTNSHSNTSRRSPAGSQSGDQRSAKPLGDVWSETGWLYTIE